jgi:hypothetical protein
MRSASADVPVPAPAGSGLAAFPAGHQRLDVIAGEDRSRVRYRNAALNLAVIRRAVVGVAVHWIKRCKNPRLATMSGFFDSMAHDNNKKALKL